MIAAENNWHLSGGDGVGNHVGDVAAGFRDLREVLRVRRTGIRHAFGLRDVNVAEIGDVVAEGSETTSESGDAHSTGAHVDAAAPLAEIERGANNGDAFIGIAHGRRR